MRLIPKEHSFEEQRIHIERANKPTVSSLIRLQLYREDKYGTDLMPDIVKVCDRATLHPSQRYYPLAFKDWCRVKNVIGERTDIMDVNNRRINSRPQWFWRNCRKYSKSMIAKYALQDFIIGATSKDNKWKCMKESLGTNINYMQKWTLKHY
ncbi:unnamed protein product [Mytilus edulis]|uniref:Uncharacterized protein n=1 Tax=Mytilus edulis TaxID=6550 RepID=A0A8S3PM07_MYTED|nr:unnamed protein product [Mytilus edulis]